MSDDTQQVHPALDNSQQQAAVDTETAQVQAENAEAIAKQEAEVKAAAATQEQDKFAQKFAALSRKEKAIREKERQLETKLQELDARNKQLEAEIRAKFIDPEMLTKDPLRVLSDRGLTPEQLAEMILNDGKKTPERMLEEYEKRMEAKIKEVEEKLSTKEKAEQEQKLQQVTNNFKAELSKFVNDNTEYELIRANSAEELVYETIEEYYNKTLDENGENGTILSNKEACDLVEQHLLDEAKKVWEKANKKLQPVFGIKQEATAAAAATTQRQSPTLSNAMSASASSSAGKKLTDEESKSEAAKLIRWID